MPASLTPATAAAPVAASANPSTGAQPAAGPEVLDVAAPASARVAPAPSALAARAPAPPSHRSAGCAAGRAAAPAGESAGHALMIAGGLLLGTLGVFVEEAGTDPLTTVWFRCAFGLLALLAWGAATGRLGELSLRGRRLVAALAAGLLMILNWALFFAAIDATSIAVATVVFHVQPLWVLAAGAWWLREPVSRGQCAAALACLAGLALATGLAGGGAAPGGDGRPYLLGVLMCLGGSLSYAGVTLIAKASRAGSYALATWQCLAGTIVLLAWPLWQGWPAAPAQWAWLAGLGIVHTGLAYVVLYAGMARLAAGRVAVLQFVYPAAAIAVDWLVYGRALGALQLAGALLMAVAMLSLLRRPVTSRVMDS